MLTISLGNGYEIEPNDSLTFYPDVISNPNTGRGSPNTTVFLLPPINPVRPTAVVRGPSTLGACGAEVLSAFESSGSAGRDLSFRWAYLGRFYPNGTAYPNSNQTHILSTLAAVITSATLELEASHYRKGIHKYVVYVSNWLDKTAYDNATVSFTKVENQIPRVQLSSPQIAVANPGSPLVLRAQIFPPNCNSVQSTSSTSQQLRTRVRWFQIFGESAHLNDETRPYALKLSQTQIEIPNPDAVTLTLPSEDLLMGSVFGFVLRSWSLDSSDNTVGELHTPFIVKMNTVPVTAVISGGNTREVSVLQSEALSFDATESLDPASNVPLLYNWTLFHPNGSTTNPPTSLPGVLALTASSLIPGARYEVLVVVTGIQSRVATARQVILTKAAKIPDVKLEFGIGKGKSKANSGKKFGLVAKALNISKWEWTCLSDNFDLDTASWSGGVLSGIEGPNLLFAPNSLTEGLAYHFKVTATGLDGGSGSADLEFQVNQPPTLGSCSISPSTGGIALKTNYRFNCGGWSDDFSDLPIEYKYQSRASSWIDLCQYRELASYTTILSQSSADESGGNITLRALITDSLGAYTTFQMKAEVLAGTSDLGNIEQLLQESASLGDFQTASILIEGIVNQAGNSPDSSTRRVAFNSALGVLKSAQNASRDSKPDPDTLISQVKSVTSSEARPESEGGGGGLSTSSALLALDLVEDVSNAETTGTMSESAVKMGLGILKNVISVSTGNDTSMSAVEKQNVVKRVEGTLKAMAQNQLANSVVGESPISIAAEGITIISQLQNPSDVAGTDFSTDDDAITIVLSDSLAFNDTDDQTPVQVLITSVESDLYPTTEKSSGVTTVELMRNGSVQSAKNESLPFEIYLPSMTIGPNDTLECRFWDPETSSWSTSGMTTIGSDSESVACQSSHLTAFSVQAIEGQTVDIDLNTFSKEDITAEAFSLNNSVMQLCTGIFGVAVLLIIIFIVVDRCHAKDGQAVSKSFWRENNYIKKQRVDVISGEQKRSMENLAESLHWGLRRKHVWTSICFRHPGDFLTSVKRVVVLVTLVFNTMTVCLLLLNTNQSIPFLGSEFSIAIVAMVLAYPVPLTVYYFFQRPTPVEWQVRMGKTGDFTAISWLLWGITILCSGSMEVDASFGEEEEMEADGDDGGDADGDDDGEVKERGEEGEDDEDKEGKGNTNHVAMAAGAGVGTWLGTELKRISVMKKRKKKKTVKYYSASHDSKSKSVFQKIENAPKERMLLGVKFQSSQGWRLDNHGLTYEDVAGFLFAFIAVLGCWFIIAVLSFKMRDKVSDWAAANLLSFCQDIFIRFIVLVFFDSLVYLPCVCCLFALPKEEKTLRLKADIYAVRFKRGSIGFHFHKLKVTHVEPNSQASQRGIKVGLRIAVIGKETIRSDRQAANVLALLHRTCDEFYIGFELQNARENDGYPPMYRFRGHVYAQSYPSSLQKDKELALLPGGIQFINRTDLDPEVLKILEENPYDPMYGEDDISMVSEEFFDTEMLCSDDSSTTDEE